MTATSSGWEVLRMSDDARSTKALTRFATGLGGNLCGSVDLGDLPMMRSDDSPNAPKSLLLDQPNRAFQVHVEALLVLVEAANLVHELSHVVFVCDGRADGEILLSEVN